MNTNRPTTRIALSLAAVASLCSFQEGPKYEFGPTMLPATGRPYKQQYQVKPDGTVLDLGPTYLDWDLGKDMNGDGKKDLLETVGRDKKGNRIVCVALQQSDVIGAQFFAYGLIKAGTPGICWFAACGFPSATNETSCKGKDLDGDNEPDVDKTGKDKGMVEEYSKIKHDNTEKAPDDQGVPRGTKDRHFCYFLEGRNEGKVLIEKTRGMWELQGDGTYKYKTNPKQTMACPLIDPPMDPRDLLPDDDRRHGNEALSMEMEATRVHMAAYALDGFRPDDASPEWHYSICINPPIGTEQETMVGDVFGPAGNHRYLEVSIRAGDRLYLSGMGLRNARVVAPASLPEYGAWTVHESTDEYVIYEATVDVPLASLGSLPPRNAYTYVIDGLRVDSLYPAGSSAAHYMGAEFGDYRLAPAPSCWSDRGHATYGAGHAAPMLVADGDFTPGSDVTLEFFDAPPSTDVWLVLGWTEADASFLNGTLVPSLDNVLQLTTDPYGRLEHVVPVSSGTPAGTQFYAQVVVPDPSWSQAAFSNGVEVTICR